MPNILYEGAEPREDPTLSAAWSAERRETYLLRPDVVRPLSVDRSVWRSPPTPDAVHMYALPWIGPAEVFAAAVAAPEPWEVVALGAVAEDEREAKALARDHGITEPLVAHAGWTFLGFDVFDGSTSGLVNCSYRPAETSALRQKWAPCLNEHGLFADAALALSFRALTNVRVPEHAPFRVVGLWTLPSVGLDVAGASG